MLDQKKLHFSYLHSHPRGIWNSCLTSQASTVLEDSLKNHLDRTTAKQHINRYGHELHMRKKDLLEQHQPDPMESGPQSIRPNQNQAEETLQSGRYYRVSTEPPIRFARAELLSRSSSKHYQRTLSDTQYRTGRSPGSFTYKTINKNFLTPQSYSSPQQLQAQHL